MPAISFEEALAAQRKTVGKKWFTGDEYRKATGSPTPSPKTTGTPVPFTKAKDPVDKISNPLFTTFAAAVDFVMERDGVNRLKATSTARRQYPELVGKLQDEADDIIQKAMEDEDDEDTRRFAAKAIERPFLAKVEHVRKRDNLSHTAALTRARKEFPRAFAEAYGIA